MAVLFLQILCRCLFLLLRLLWSTFFSLELLFYLLLHYLILGQEV